MAFKNIPISAATDLLHRYNKDEILIFTYDQETGSFTFTSDGSTEEHKENAARGSDHLIKVLERSGTFGKEYTNNVVEDPSNRLPATKTIEEAYSAGFDTFTNGATIENSNFHFLKP